jgi:hypothetical protein
VGHEEPSGGFGLLVDGALGDEGFISSLLFLQYLLQKRHGVFKAKLFRPSDEGPVAGNYVMLYRCAAARRPASSAGEPLYSFMMSAPSSVMPTMASHVLPWGFLSMAANTCSRRPICSSVSASCFSNAAPRAAEQA